MIKLYDSETRILKCMDCPYLRTIVSHALNNLMVLHIRTDKTDSLSKFSCKLKGRLNLLVIEKVDIDHF